MNRPKKRIVKVGKVKVGGNSPITVQSMTNVKTSDIRGCVKQIRSLEKAGCELIRVSVKDTADAKAIGKIKNRINIPIIADIHFDHRLALEAIDNKADKIRVNPGNIKKIDDLKKIIKAAKKNNTPIRIGVNSGSVGSPPLRGENRLVSSALEYIKIFEREKFYDIIISLKSSSVGETVRAYRELSAESAYPLHLGITAAGPYSTGIVKSAVGIGSLLLDGIGDTLRVSLTGDPEQEIIAAKRILQASEARSFGPEILSCPTCGRCQVDLAGIVSKAEKRLILGRNRIKKPVKIAIMGCEVNGPGEAKEADIGIAFGKDAGVLFKNGKVIRKIKAKDSVKEILRYI